MTIQIINAKSIDKLSVTLTKIITHMSLAWGQTKNSNIDGPTF